MQDLFGIADQIQYCRADDDAGNQIAKDQTGSQTLKNRRDGDRCDQKDQRFAKK